MSPSNLHHHSPSLSSHDHIKNTGIAASTLDKEQMQQEQRQQQQPKKQEEKKMFVSISCRSVSLAKGSFQIIPVYVPESSSKSPNRRSFSFLRVQPWLWFNNLFYQHDCNMNINMKSAIKHYRDECDENDGNDSNIIISFHEQRTIKSVHSRSSSFSDPPISITATRSSAINYNNARTSSLPTKESDDTMDTTDTSYSADTCIRCSFACTCTPYGAIAIGTTITKQDELTVNRLMYPCLYIRATDLTHSLPTMDGNCHHNHHPHLIKPHPMKHLDDDPNQLFIALTSSSSPSPNTTATDEMIQPSPILSNITKLLLKNGVDFVTNTTYWNYHHQSGIQTTPLPSSTSLSSSSSSNEIYFPQVYKSEDHNNNDDLKVSKISLSNDQIKTLKQDVLLWIGEAPAIDDQSSMSIPSFPQLMHNHNSNSFVAIRAYGIIQMKPKELYELILDSDRIKEYNLYSLGRDDIWVHDYEYQETNQTAEEGDEEKDNDENEESSEADTDGKNHDCYRSAHDNAKQKEKKPIHRITKVCHGTNKPPLVRKPIPYMTLFHCQELTIKSLSSNQTNEQFDNDHCNDKGYIISARTAKQVDSNGVMKDVKSYSAEIMLGSTLLLPIDGHDDLTLFINANVVSSPMPTYLIKKFGLSGAVNYVNWLRSVSMNQKY